MPISLMPASGEFIRVLCAVADNDEIEVRVEISTCPASFHTIRATVQKRGGGEPASFDLHIDSIIDEAIRLYWRRSPSNPPLAGSGTDLGFSWKTLPLLHHPDFRK